VRGAGRSMFTVSACQAETVNINALRGTGDTRRSAMPKTIYEKPTRVLLKDMVATWKLQPGESFNARRAVSWFADNYPKLKSGSIKAHLVQASTNDPSRLHHTSTNSTDDLLFRVGSREYRLYEPGKDPTPIHRPNKVQVPSAGGGTVTLVDDDDDAGPAADAAVAGSSQFALEKDLQRYLSDNLHIIEPGLTLFQDEDISGFEYPAGGGRRIDILAQDAAGNFVVLELKVEKGYDRVVGQLLRYTNWVRKELAEPGQRVRGIIVCRTMSEDLILACSGIWDVELFEYRLQVSVTKVPSLDLGA
jgi:endonuclease